MFPAIGDNQASFLGSVGGIHGSILVNVGTGSQISVFVDRYLDAAGIDTRPFPLGGYIGVGAALCGGKAYSILHDFFERTMRLFTGGEAGASWELMNAVAGGTAGGEPLHVDTRFAGTRATPGCAGRRCRHRHRQPHPENLIVGVREGIADELLGFLAHFPDDVRQSRRPSSARATGSG